jgi:hypothetical protein
VNPEKIREAVSKNEILDGLVATVAKLAPHFLKPDGAFDWEALHKFSCEFFRNQEEGFETLVAAIVKEWGNREAQKTF